jgi:hypothetical protein
LSQIPECHRLWTLDLTIDSLFGLSRQNEEDA